MRTDVPRIPHGRADCGVPHQLLHRSHVHPLHQPMAAPESPQIVEPDLQPHPLGSSTQRLVRNPVFKIPLQFNLGAFYSARTCCYKAPTPCFASTLQTAIFIIALVPPVVILVSPCGTRFSSDTCSFLRLPQGTTMLRPIMSLLPQLHPPPFVAVLINRLCNSTARPFFPMR